eukprot:1194015-Prorocentrum_minimum.AAC.2
MVLGTRLWNTPGLKRFGPTTTCWPARRLAGIWLLLVGCLLLGTCVVDVAGHGYLKEPPSRNWYAHTDGRWWCGGDGECDNCPGGNCPEKESCPMCLNRSGPDAICGLVEGRNYNHPKSTTRDPFPSVPLRTYQPGATIDLEMVFTAHHRGHVELQLCDDPVNPTKACFDAHPLEFVSADGNPAPDPNYPYRGYLRPNDGSIPDDMPAGTGVSGFRVRMTYKLPDGFTCNHCLILWHYVSANSCLPPGGPRSLATFPVGLAHPLPTFRRPAPPPLPPFYPHSSTSSTRAFVVVGP